MFYRFSQNNSGGIYDITDKVNKVVIVEAASPSEANDIAEDIGLYFNGVRTGIDCDCCGDRWSAQLRDDEGDEVPAVYSRPITKFRDERTKATDVVIYYKDGTLGYGISPKYKWSDSQGKYVWTK